MAGANSKVSSASPAAAERTSDDGSTTSRFKVTSRKYQGGGAVVLDLLILIIVVALGYLSKGTTGAEIGFVIGLIIVALLSIRVISEWNRMAVLRLGKYEGIIGPGLYLIMPIFESTPINVDLRVITSPFAAEKTLTKDNVPVDVDAILFWQVHDPENAILNVQNYMNSVLLASQTAMRDIIGKSELSEMLAGRDIIGKDIQELIEERIHNWGIDAISVEIRDVKIPTDLQNAMARVATSDREKQARVILAESESLAADKMLEASAKYQKDPYAMQLRALNMMYEVSTNGKNLIIFIPTENKGFSMPTPMGIIGLEEAMKRAQQGQKPKKEKS
jgi:regulator of protease activity HflC (stomatin/prohibitin superfamily)